MVKIHNSKNIFYPFLIFVFFNTLLFIYIFNFDSLFPFNEHNYKYNSHHYLQDKRVTGENFSLLNALGQYDAQWYLQIAERGYPKSPTNTDIGDKTKMDGLTYAFFPLYPIFVKSINFFVGNVELSAFLLSTLFLILNFFSLYYLVSNLYGVKTAVKTIFLIFFFPFSIFFRSYFTEGLYLFLLIWFSYFLIKRKFLHSSFFLALINITKMSGFLLNIIFSLMLLKEYRKKKLKLDIAIYLIMMMSLPFLTWMLYNFWQTGDFLYFLSVRKSWSLMGNIFFLYPLYNFTLYFAFPLLPLHFFHFSLIDLSVILIVLIILIKSRKVIRNELRIISFAIWLSPLLIHDPMSFSRYQIVSFPLFMYLARVLSGRKYFLIFAMFFIFLLITSALFVNWYWVG